MEILSNHHETFRVELKIEGLCLLNHSVYAHVNL